MLQHAYILCNNRCHEFKDVRLLAERSAACIGPLIVPVDDVRVRSKNGLYDILSDG
jgi:hypothetical protein